MVPYMHEIFVAEKSWVRFGVFCLRKNMADGESLGDFAFRKAIRHLRCSETDGVAFWVDMVGYSSALAYGVLIPLFLVPKLQEVSMKFHYYHIITLDWHSKGPQKIQTYSNVDAKLMQNSCF